MSADTKIEWAHHTLNPWLGCAKVHAGCTHCYAERHQAVVMRKGGKVAWGEVWAGGQRVVTSASTWRQPYAWARAAAKAGERRRVFCGSLCDVLEVPGLPTVVGGRAAGKTEAQRRVVETASALDAARARLWDVIRETAELPSYEANIWDRPKAGLDWLLLSKRPENWRLVPEDVRSQVGLGTSISDQKTADEWVPRLLEAEGFWLRFLSVEPLVGPVDLEPFFAQPDKHGELSGPRCNPDGSPAIGWVIVGGESGPKARSCNVEWVRDIVRQCHEAGVPCFVKQLGSRPEHEVTSDEHRPFQEGLVSWTEPFPLTDPKGGDPSEWPEDLRVRQLPEVIHA